MKRKSIFKQMLIPMIAIVTLLAMVLVTIIAAFFISFYKKEIQIKNKEHAGLLSESIQIFVDGASIILKKYEPNCIFCGSTKKLIPYNDKLVCNKCLEKLNKLAEEAE